MPFTKPRRDLKIAILVPCYKRPEYTKRCIRALEEAQEYSGVVFFLVDDGSKDDTIDLLRNFNPRTFGHYKHIVGNKENRGLRDTVVDFFEWTRERGFDFIAKIDNDVLMPKDWLNKMLDIFEKTNAGILSPNYLPSNPAFKYGMEGKEFRPTSVIGGIWVMRAGLIKDIVFEKHKLWGIKGAMNIMKQIFIEKQPVAGWVTSVLAQDLGHWSGDHPEHIKSEEHIGYYNEVGRNLSYA